MVRFIEKIFFLMILCSSLWAQELPDISLKAGGTIQAMFSSSETNTDTSQIGFGIRRFRVFTKAKVGKYISAFAQFDGAGSLSNKSFKLLDARIEYEISNAFKVRVGRFIGAGIRAGGLTSHHSIDIVERPASAVMWGARTVGADYRSLGVELMGISKAGLTGRVFLHNGNGGTNVIAKQTSLSSKQMSGIAVDVMAAYKPNYLKGAEIGGSYGKGNKYINDYSSFSFYYYQNIEQFKFKAEYISATNKFPNASDLTFLGYYVFGGYSITKNVELLARYEFLNPNTDVDNIEENLYTLGAAYFFYPTDKILGKITGAYVIHDEEPKIDNNILYFMFQLRYEM